MKLFVFFALSLGVTFAAFSQSDLPRTTTSSQPTSSIAPDFNPKALWDGRKIVPFHALDYPKMVPASEATFLNDGDYVLGITGHGESRAYPTRFLWWHHVINDRLGQSGAAGASEEVAVTYCSVCNTGIRYDLASARQPVKLDFYGLYNGVVALCDRETGSAFLQVDGRFATGPLAGVKLTPGPVLDTTWGRWKLLHPDTLVMPPDTPDQQHYSPKDHPEPRGYDHFPAPFFQPSVARTDKRLPFFEPILGVTVPAAHTDSKNAHPALHRAYSLQALKGAGNVINDTLGSTTLAVFLDPETLTGVAVSRQLDGQTLTFKSQPQPNGPPAIFDEQTKTLWTLEGLAEAGPLKGKSLTRLDSHHSQWYGWVAYFPDTTIHGRSDPPQPVDLTSAGPTHDDQKTAK